MKSTYFLFCLLALSNMGQAALIGTGGGFVNDTVQKITWLKDANLFKTLCDAANPLATQFVPLDRPDAATICQDNGQMSWNDAKAWLARLNAYNYLGYSDWRQARTRQPDDSCEEQEELSGFPAQGWGKHCVASELGHLFYHSLSQLTVQQSAEGAGKPATQSCYPDCFVNNGPFHNIQKLAYWSETLYAPDPQKAWSFGTIDGIQDYDEDSNKHSFHLVWPVRTGQSVVAISVSQDVSSLSIWGLGFMVLLAGFVIRRLLHLFTRM